MSRRPPAARRGGMPWAVALALVPAVVVAGGTPSGAVGSDVITVDGTAVLTIVDDFGKAPALADSFVSVDVDGSLVPVPAADAADLTGGDAVEVRLDAPAGMSTDDAVAAAAQGDVEVLEVVRTADAAAARADDASAADAGPDDANGGLQAVSPAGEHTLTVLPVYWDGETPPAATLDALRTMAADSVAYWAETSRGTMTFAPPVVADFVQIAAPTSCSLAGGVQDIYTRALAAHGVPNPGLPSASTHIAVYFPTYGACGGWLGLASTYDGRIWVNGLPTAEVLAHEMGHNLGLGHANAIRCYTASRAQVPFLVDDPTTPADGSCTTQTYGDYADLMGPVWNKPPGNLTTALATDLELVDLAPLSTSAVTPVQLAPLWDETGLRAVRIPVDAQRSFFVDYRPAADRDTRFPTWAGVQVHERRVVDGIPESSLLEMDPTGPGAGVAMRPGTRYTFPSGPTGRWTVVLDGVGATAALRVIPPAGFVDVYLANPFYADIAWLRHTGISTGTSTPTGQAYLPSQAVTREAMAAFLYRAAGSPAFTPPATSPFADVSTGHPFYAAIAWLAATGISTGTAVGDQAFFKPGNRVSRDAMAAFLYRAAGSPAVTPPATSPFADVSTGHPFYAAIAWMAASGVSTGTVTASGTYYKPADAVSRAAMAAFLYRYDTI